MLTLEQDILREELQHGINYIEHMLPKIKNKEISFNMASKVVKYIDELFSKHTGQTYPGLQEEVNRIYGRSNK
jgi:hypothetical protein